MVMAYVMPVNFNIFNAATAVSTADYVCLTVWKWRMQSSSASSCFKVTRRSPRCMADHGNVAKYSSFQKQKFNILEYAHKRSPLLELCLSSPGVLAEPFELWNISPGASGNFHVTKYLSESSSFSSCMIGEDKDDLFLNSSLSQGSIALVVGTCLSIHEKALVKLLKVVQSNGGLAVSIISTPFTFEGQKRQKVDKLITKLTKISKLCVVVDSNALLERETVTLTEAVAATSKAVFLAMVTASTLVNDSYLKLLDVIPACSEVASASTLINILDDFGNACVGFGIGFSIKGSIEQATLGCPFSCSSMLSEINTVIICVASAQELDSQHMQAAIDAFRLLAKSSSRVVCSTVVDASLERNVFVSSIILSGKGRVHQSSSVSGTHSNTEGYSLTSENIFNASTTEGSPGNTFVRNFCIGLEEISDWRKNITGLFKPFLNKIMVSKEDSNGKIDKCLASDASMLSEAEFAFEESVTPQHGSSQELDWRKCLSHTVDENLFQPSHGTSSAEESISNHFKDACRTSEVLESHTVEFDCFIKDGNSKAVEKSNEEIAAQQDGDYFLKKYISSTKVNHHDWEPNSCMSVDFASNQVTEESQLHEKQLRPKLIPKPVKEESINTVDTESSSEEMMEQDRQFFFSENFSDKGLSVVMDIYHAASMLISQKFKEENAKQGILSARAMTMLESDRGVNENLNPVIKMRYRGGIYSGRCQGGLPHGKGSLSFNDGSFYEGSWKHGSRWGIGAFHYSTGDIFQGSWRDDLMHGKGWLYFKHGDRFFANFWKGKANGEGRYYSQGGDVFFGQFQDNLRHGRGIYIESNGIKWEEFWEFGVLVNRVQL